MKGIDWITLKDADGNYYLLTPESAQACQRRFGSLSEDSKRELELAYRKKSNVRVWNNVHGKYEETEARTCITK